MNDSLQKKRTALALKVTSPAFGSREDIPPMYTCDGDNINPPLTIRDLPPETQSLALIVEDPDAPSKTWVHWLVWNIKPFDTINENSVPGIQGTNDFRRKEYGGPCPPTGTHRYLFKVFALSKMLNIPEGSLIKELEKEMEPYILSTGELVGTYQRK